VRLELARVYREIDQGNLDSRDGWRRAAILKMIGEVLTASELEKRLVELEEGMSEVAREPHGRLS